MKLKEVLEQVNNILKENLEKPVIELGGYKEEYDFKNGRIIYDDIRLEKLLRNEFNLSYISISNSNEFKYAEIKFIIKKKKSGIISDFTNKMTYSEITIKDDYIDYLNKEIEEIEHEYKIKIEQNRENQKKKNLEDINSFELELKKYNMSLEEFKNLMSKYNTLPYEYKNKDIILNIIK